MGASNLSSVKFPAFGLTVVTEYQIKPCLFKKKEKNVQIPDKECLI